jgi:type I restriction enzyme S subunit
MKNLKNEKTETKNGVVPKLRFPEFRRCGEWEMNALGEIASITKGKGISKADVIKDGSIPCIRYGELYTHYSETITDVISRTNIPTKELVLSQSNDVIIPASGETQEDIAKASCVMNRGVALGGDLNIIRSKNNGIYLSYYLNSAKQKDIAQLAQGISVVHLYPDSLKKLRIHTPTLPEQSRIADCLSSLDALIAAHSQKLDGLKSYKKGLMQQLFPAKGEKVPKLRFPEFRKSGEWEESIIQDLCEKPFSGGTPTTSRIDFYGGSIPFIRSAEIGADQTELFLTQAGLDNSSAKMVKPGDVLFALYGANSGDVAISRITGAINQAILCLRSKSSNEFLYQYLTHKKDQITSTYLQGGQGNLSGDIVKSIDIMVPSPSEQHRIASFLSSIDNLITAQSQKIESLKTHKKGLMQQLFPAMEEANA